MIRSLVQVVSLALLLVVGSELGVSAAFAQGAVGAETGTPAQLGFTAMLLQMLPMFAMVFLIFHFLVVRPQAQKAKLQDELIKSLKRGDSVATSSGIVGKISSIEGDLISLEVSSGVKLRIEANHIAKKRDVAASDKAAA